MSTDTDAGTTEENNEAAKEPTHVIAKRLEAGLQKRTSKQRCMDTIEMCRRARKAEAEVFEVRKKKGDEIFDLKNEVGSLKSSADRLKSTLKSQCKNAVNSLQIGTFISSQGAYHLDGLATAINEKNNLLAQSETLLEESRNEAARLSAENAQLRNALIGQAVKWTGGDLGATNQPEQNDDSFPTRTW